LRQASKIFKAWAQIAPEEAQRIAKALPNTQTNAGLRRMLFKHLPYPGGRHPGIAVVNRASIDAILNHPDRTSPYSGPSYGLEIHGDVLSDGEAAFTFEEWAARNPELARDSLQASPDSPSWRGNLVMGLARTNPDYLGLLELGPPDTHLQVALNIVGAVGNIAADEGVWQLDGRESSWTLNFEQRKAAMQRLVAEGNFSAEERATLAMKMSVSSTNYDFIKFPELPNKLLNR
jgi:hypothetical protein